MTDIPDVLAFLGEAFRNIDLPELDDDDLRDIGMALDAFARRQVQHDH